MWSSVIAVFGAPCANHDLMLDMSVLIPNTCNYTPLAYPASDDEGDDGGDDGNSFELCQPQSRRINNRDNQDTNMVLGDNGDTDYDNDGTNSNGNTVHAGSKRVCSPSDNLPGQLLQKAVKLHESGPNGPKVGDYAPEVCFLAKLAIFLFHSKLSNEDPFPDAMLALVWSKAAWADANKTLESSISPNCKLIKLVCAWHHSIFSINPPLNRPLSKPPIGVVSSRQLSIPWYNPCMDSRVATPNTSSTSMWSTIGSWLTILVFGTMCVAFAISIYISLTSS